MKPKTQVMVLATIALMTAVVGIQKSVLNNVTQVTNSSAQSITTLSINPNKIINPFANSMRGVGLVNWEHSWGKPFPAEIPGLTQALKEINPGIIRYGGGLWANSVGFDRTKQRTPYTAWTNKGNTYYFTYGTDELDSIARLQTSVNAKIIMQGNISNNDPAMWADMVRYTNKEKGYNFPYWEFGNELDFDADHKLDPAEYARRFTEYTRQIASVDASANVIGAAPAYPVVQNDATNALSGFVTLLPQAAQSGGKSLDALTWHWYQQCNISKISDVTIYDWGSSVAPNSWRNAYTRNWAKLLPARIQTQVLANYPTTKQGITELNVDACNYNNPLNGNHIGAIWFADVLGRLAYNGIDFVTMYQGYGEQAYSLLYPTNGKIAARPIYYTYLMYAKYFGDQMLETTSTNESNLSVWASTDSKDPGKIKLMITNLSANPITSQVQANTQTTSASIYTLKSTNPTDLSATSATANASTNINGIKIDAMNVAGSIAQIKPVTIQINDTKFNYTFDPYSVTAIILNTNTTNGTPIATPIILPGTDFGCNNLNFFTINGPQKYIFNKACMKTPIKIYNDDQRFTFFALPTAVSFMPYVQSPNTSIKEDSALSWSVILTHPATIRLLYRKIPGQLPPTWIRSQYTKNTDDNFSNLQQFAMRKNEDGLIGLYDIYTKNTQGTGTITFGPASDTTTTAYSMYLVTLDPE